MKFSPALIDGKMFDVDVEFEGEKKTENQFSQNPWNQFDEVDLLEVLMFNEKHVISPLVAWQ